MWNPVGLWIMYIILILNWQYKRRFTYLINTHLKPKNMEFKFIMIDVKVNI